MTMAVTIIANYYGDAIDIEPSTSTIGSLATTTATAMKTPFQNVTPTSSFAVIPIGLTENGENVIELSRDYITMNGIKVRKMKDEFAFMRSRSSGNLKFAEDGREMCQNVKRTCRAIVFAH